MLNLIDGRTRRAGRAFRASRAWWDEAIAFTMAAWTALAGPALASTVVPMNLTTMADYAGQVIVGRVAAVRSYWADDPRRIETEITFEQVDYLKGRLEQSTPTIKLIVPGGTVGEWTARLSGAPEPAVGQQWVLFLLPEYKTYPVVGLWQGAFRVEPDADGVARVLDAGGQPVTGFDEEGYAKVATAGTPKAATQLVGATNMRVKTETPTETARAMTLADFKAVLTPALERSKDHHLTETAGKRVPADLRPVPLRTAPNAGGVHESPRGAGVARPAAESPTAGTDAAKREGRGTP